MSTPGRQGVLQEAIEHTFDGARRTLDVARLTEGGSPPDLAPTSEEEPLRMIHLIALGSQNDPKLQLYMEQHGRCAVCKRAYTQELLCIDHDHETQLIRGLLCRRCNTRDAISDDDELLAELDRYRQTPPAQGRWKYEGLTELGRLRGQMSPIR